MAKFLNEISFKTRTSVGFTFSFLWCLSTALANVLTGAIEQQIAPILVCFFTFLIAGVFFFTCNYKNSQALFQKCIAQFNDVLSLNFTTLGCWFFWLYSLKYIEPAISGAIIVGIRPFSTIILGKFIYKNQRVNPSDYIGALLLLFAILYLSYLSFTGKTAITYQVSDKKIFLALLSCIFGGVILGANTIYTKRLSNTGFTSKDILSVRFILSIIILGGVILFLNLPIIRYTENFLFDILILTFSLIIIPQYFFQEAVARLEPISTAMMAPLMPVLAFFLQYTDKRLHPTGFSILGIISVFIIVLFSIINRYKIEHTG